jgi:hypothetical protein
MRHHPSLLRVSAILSPPVYVEPSRWVDKIADTLNNQRAVRTWRGGGSLASVIRADMTTFRMKQDMKTVAQADRVKRACRRLATDGPRRSHTRGSRAHLQQSGGGHVAGAQCAAVQAKATLGDGLQCGGWLYLPLLVGDIRCHNTPH